MKSTKNAAVRNIISILLFSFLLISLSNISYSQNKTESLEDFKSLGYGLFIHWSLDSQIGTVISHSLVGSSDEYKKKFFERLPETFHPSDFDPQKWARLAKVNGVKYVVFTAKHHSGFCMFDTETTEFNITNTPYGKDITKEVIDAFRSRGIKIGLYFSPDDFHFIHSQGHLISRNRSEALPTNNPELMSHNKEQIRELMTEYGPIDILFIDGEAEGIRELAWDINPDLVITRGAMETPEIAPSTNQELPAEQLPDVWEAVFTMGTSWHYRPTNHNYRDGTDLIETLIETRAKNGNMLLNVGPTPNGEIPTEQKGLLREIGTWLFVNEEAVHNIEPWVVTNENNIWFTQSKNTNAVYAIVTRPDWEWGTRKTVSLESVRATDSTNVHVLGQNGKVLEYNTDVDPEPTWTNTPSGLVITAYRAQRIYNDRTWPNPVVLKITNPKPVEP